RFVPVIAAQFPYIDDVNINLTGVAFASSRIFTLSTFGSAIQARAHLGRYRASNVAIASRSPPPAPRPGSRAAGSSPRTTGRIATATPRRHYGPCSHNESDAPYS